MAIFYQIKRPGGTNRVFAINRQLRDAEGKSTYSKVDSPELRAINKAYLDGTHSLDAAMAQLHDLRRRLYLKDKERPLKPLTHSENLKLFEAYWKDEYSDRDLIAPRSMRNDILRSLEAIGPLSLLTASRQELYQRLSEAPANKQRRMAARLNQLLKYAKREFRIRLKKPEHLEVRYLSFDDFIILRRHLPHPIDKLSTIAFASGCRVGEIFALDETSLKQGFKLWVPAQLDSAGRRRATKNRIARHTLLFPFGRDALSSWLAIPEKERLIYRNAPHAKILKKAAKELWKTEPRKHVCFHDLRHSFAIFCLSQGIVKDRVAELLGDSLIVVERFYTGFTITDENIDSIAERLKLAQS